MLSITTNKEINLTFKLPEFSINKVIKRNLNVDEQAHARTGYDMILGRDFYVRLALYSTSKRAKSNGTAYPYQLVRIPSLVHLYVKFPKLGLVHLYAKTEKHILITILIHKKRTTYKPVNQPQKCTENMYFTKIT